MKFMDRYHAGSFSAAVINCAKEKHPDVWKNLVDKCGKAAADGYKEGTLPVY
jgi:hypothetical protein